MPERIIFVSRGITVLDYNARNGKYKLKMVYSVV